MEMRTTRKMFLGGVAALAVCPKILQARDDPRTAVWEKSDGTATDNVMVRRLYLDIAGRIPTKGEAQAYVYSGNPNKRDALVERLLYSDDFANYWTMRFCDLLRVKSEFPINLWPNAVYVYHARIRAFVEHNEPWDAFGRVLLTSQGSDFRDPEVNFFRATDRRSPDGWAEATAQTFLGIPPSQLSSARRTKLVAAFANVRIKTTREWKEEIVYVDGTDYRRELCDTLFNDSRQYVADAFLNGIRTWLFGPDTVRVKNVDVEMRLKDVLRKIVLSDEYARGSITGGFPVRRLDAEVLDDAFCALSGSDRNYQSPAPEPFTFLPPARPTVCIEDGSISNGFLTLFGRPARDTGLMDERGQEVTAKQRLYLFNSGKLHRQLERIVAPPDKQPGGTPHPIYRIPFAERVDDIYWRLLARAATPREHRLIVGLLKKRGGGTKKVRPLKLLRDVAWCLVNSKEFIFRI